MSLFTRSGTVTDLAIEMYLAGELTPEQAAELDAHLAEHPDCRARVEAARAHRDAFSAPLPDALADALAAHPPAPANTTRWYLAAAAGVAAVAAAILLVVGPWTAPPSEDVLTLRGSGLRFEVVLDDGEGGRALSTGDAVHAGDRLGFRAQAAHDGWLLVVGTDDAGAVYAGFPRDAVQAEAFAAGEAMVTLPAAIRLDDTLGRERLVAVHCPHPFDVRQVRTALEAAPGMDAPLPSLLDDCVQDDVILQKVPR